MHIRKPLFILNPKPTTIETRGGACNCSNLSHEVRGVDEQTHQDAAEGAGDRDGEDPADEQEENPVPVDGLGGAVAEADADGRAGDAHGRGHGERELREDEDGDGRA